MTTLTFTRENVVATFPDFAEVYDAVMALELAGIDGGDIRVFGEGVERAAELAESEVAVVDVQSMRRLVPRMTAGALIGAAVGAALGLLGVVLVDGESGAAAVGECARAGAALRRCGRAGGTLHASRDGPCMGPLAGTRSRVRLGGRVVERSSGACPGRGGPA